MAGLRNNNNTQNAQWADYVGVLHPFCWTMKWNSP